MGFWAKPSLTMRAIDRARRSGPARTRLAARALVAIAVLGAAGAAPALGAVTVKGRFLYEDRPFGAGGFTGGTTQRPIRFAEVRIMASTETLATGSTDAAGEYSISVPGLPPTVSALAVTTSGPGQGLLADVRLARIDFSGGDLFAVSSGTAAVLGVTLDLGTTVAAAGTDAGKVFNIWDVLVDGLEFVASANASGAFPAVRLTALWRSTNLASANFYQSANHSIYVRSLTAYDDTIISHEMGHFVDDVYSKSDNPGGQHFLGDDAQDIRLAWSEGLATFLGSSFRRFHGYDRPDLYVQTDGINLNFAYEIETLTGSFVLDSKTGSTNEVAVTAALWDIVDGPSTPDGSPGDDDPLERPFAEVWKVLTRYLPTRAAGISIEDFWNGWFAPGIANGSLAGMQTVFATVNGIEFLADADEPDDTPGGAAGLQVAAEALADGPRVLLSEVDLGDVDLVELYNAGSTAADLTGWKIVASRAGFATATYTIPSFTLPPGGFVTISEAAGTNTGTALFAAVSISWQNLADGACALLDAAGRGRDFARWGSSTEPPPSGTLFASPNAASPPRGKTLARDFAATDTDRGADWLAAAPTPGTFNRTGLERHHTFYPAGDLDLAAIDVVAGRRYLIETLGLASGADPLLEVVTDDGAAVLAAGDDFGGGRAAKVAWSAPSTGRFRVRVRRSPAATTFARYGSYDLRIIEASVPFSGSVPAVLTVSKPGNGGAYGSIGAALAAAVSGDTIEIVDSETYAERPVMLGKSLTLRAARGRSPVIDGGSGGGATLTLTNTKSARLEGLRIAGGGRGVSVFGGSALIASTIVERAADPGGFADGIVAGGSGGSVTVVHSTIVGNGRHGLYVSSPASARVVNSIFRGNGGTDVTRDAASTSVTVTGSFLRAGGFSGSGNSADDPRFLDGPGGDFRLQAGSPAIDAGAASDLDLPGLDADGLPRLLDGDGNGSALPDAGAYEYLPASSLTFSGVFAQIAAGGNDPVYRSSVVALNPGAREASLQLTLARSAGATFQEALGSKGAGPLNRALPALGILRVEASLAGDLVSGYARLASSAPVEGTALVRTVSGDTITGEAAVGVSRPARRFALYVDNARAANTGYALVNPGTARAELTLTPRDEAGRAGTPVSLGLEPGEHVAEFAGRRFAAAGAGFEGSLEFESDQPVSAVALRFDNPDQDVFSTVPLVSADDASTLLYFPQVADGGGYRTHFVLINTEAVPATARLEFFDASGAPLEIPAGGSASSTRDLVLAARGTARLVTDGLASELRSGWVRVTSAAKLGGSAIFQTVQGGRIRSEAGVPASPPAARLASYVESRRNRTASGVALCNPNADPVTLRLRLRDTGGGLVASTTLTLPGLGQIARFVSGPGQLFPAGFEDFEGTLEIAAASPVSGVALRFDNALADVFATLPLVPLP